jgi:hypothetical protein
VNRREVTVDPDGTVHVDEDEAEVQRRPGGRVSTPPSRPRDTDDRVDDDEQEQP